VLETRVLEKSSVPEPASNEPLLKWTGGERWLAPTVVEMLRATSFSRYFEPFCGGAAVFFHLHPTRAVLSDTNAELINCYEQIKLYPQKVIAALRKWENSSDAYYAVRESRLRSPTKRAARVMYLTSLSFNGIFRVNQRGEFNVPYGQRTHRIPADAEKILAASQRLKAATLLVADFEAAAAEAKSNDLLYFDPPYTVAHGNNGFVKYNEKILQWDDQIRLATVAAAAASKGCKVLVSNADHPAVHELYQGFRLKRIQRSSVMAASASHRRPITEVLFYRGI
jgi:DNA adenine methylase